MVNRVVRQSQGKGFRIYSLWHCGIFICPQSANTGCQRLHLQTLPDSGMISTPCPVRLELKGLGLHLSCKVQIKVITTSGWTGEQEWSLVKDDAVWSASPDDRLCVTRSCFVAVAAINTMLTACCREPNWSQITHDCKKCFPSLPYVQNHNTER